MLRSCQQTLTQKARDKIPTFSHKDGIYILGSQNVPMNIIMITRRIDYFSFFPFVLVRQPLRPISELLRTLGCKLSSNREGFTQSKPALPYSTGWAGYLPFHSLKSRILLWLSYIIYPGCRLLGTTPCLHSPSCEYSTSRPIRPY